MSRAAYATRLTSCHPCSMRLCGPRLRVSAWLVFALVAVLTLRSAQATGAERKRTDCTWGASSIRAEVVDGKFVVSPAVTSGCIPTKPRRVSTKLGAEQP
jgi:hypothetical protein